MDLKSFPLSVTCQREIYLIYRTAVFSHFFADIKEIQVILCVSAERMWTRNLLKMNDNLSFPKSWMPGQYESVVGIP